jgi:hypothetical protein
LKITLDSIISGFKSVTKLIANFDLIESELNDKVLYRDNPDGEPNQMENNLDMNGNRITNLPTATNNTDPVTYGQFQASASVVQFTGTVVNSRLGSDAAGSTFTVSEYTPGSSNLQVYLNGVLAPVSTYTEPTSTTVVMNTAPVSDDEYTFIINSRQVDTSTVPASSVTYTPTGGAATNADAHLKTVDTKIQGIVNVKEFGAVGDGVTDDTVAIQAGIDLIYATKGQLYFPNGDYLISSTLVIPNQNNGWSFQGEGRIGTSITQATDNIPVLDIGDDGVNISHSLQIKDISFGYTNDQTGNTNAICIYISTQDNFHMTFKRLKFNSGYWGIKHKVGTGGTWGSNWDELEWADSVVGGAIDFTGATNAIPNNKWGRFSVDASNMTEGTIFKEVKGYNWTWDTVEIYGGSTNLRLVSFQAGSSCIIGSFKAETITINTALAGNSLFTCPTNGYIKIGSFHLGGTTCVLTPLSTTAIFTGPAYLVDIGFLDLKPSAATSNMYICSTGRMVVKQILRLTYEVPFTNLASTESAENLTIESIANDQLSADKGDADYTLTLGDPNNISYETTLTAPRTVTLPGADGDIYSDGGSRGSVLTDNSYTELMYRRHPTGGPGWRVVSKGTL